MPKRAPVRKFESSGQPLEALKEPLEEKPIEPYQPSAGDLAWYQEWAVRHRSVSDIAASLDVSYHVVHRVVRRVEEWLRLELFDDVVAFRVRQTEALERAAAQALQRWTETSDIRYLAESRKLLVDIRKMWGVDKPQQVEAKDSRSEGLERVAGIDRAEALRLQAARLLEVADELSSGQKTPGSHPV
jgi:hypothetical protein